MKILFLDIDGVLNTDRSHTVRTPQGVLTPNGSYRTLGNAPIYLESFDPIAVANLNKITDATGAKIVVSSTWRVPFIRNGCFQVLVEYLKEQGVTGTVIGYTPTLQDYVHEVMREELGDFYGQPILSRGKEIALWLKKNTGYTEFVSMDDDPTVGEIEATKQHWVQTYWDEGITAEDAEKAIRILNGDLV